MSSDLFDAGKDPFGLPPVPAAEPDKTGANAPPECSVSQLSDRLKRTVEEEFSFVRVRGEISRVTVARSGHLYTSLKDESAVLDAVCWKGALSRLSVRPEEGMEVVCTGRITTYPGRSNYQLVIETMELAGAGALLKMLEDRRKRLAAEGLFDAARKKPIPFLPETVGVITSPTGAVIRDILHRISERFPLRVLLWPVTVQGQDAARQVAAAIDGFNALPPGSPHRPGVLIVARGGGSLEDLMPFNDEIVVRAAARSAIPLISAVGHETDTTLIDLAADLRAPTPTAAAEKAVPVRGALMAQAMDLGSRLFAAARLRLRHAQVQVAGLARGLGDPRRRLETAAQRLDHLSLRLDGGLVRWVERRAARVDALSARVAPGVLRQRLGEAGRRTAVLEERLRGAQERLLRDHGERLRARSALLESLSFTRVLERGYSVVYDKDGRIVSSAEKTRPGDDITVHFRDGRRGAKVSS